MTAYFLLLLFLSYNTDNKFRACGCAVPAKDTRIGIDRDFTFHYAQTAFTASGDTGSAPLAKLAHDPQLPAPPFQFPPAI
jgi:hypothetical protein